MSCSSYISQVLAYPWGELIDLNTLGSQLTSLPGLAASGFALYFANRKFGNKVLCTYTFQFGGFSAPQIQNIVLINRKDKPIPIFSIVAVVNNEIFLEVEKFETPLILGPLQTVHVIAKPFSCYHIGMKEFEIRSTVHEDIDIYLISEKGKIKCKEIGSPSFAHIRDFQNLSHAVKRTDRFNGLVYNEKALYAITYVENSIDNTVFVDVAGVIHWRYTPNAVPKECLASEQTLRKALDSAGFDKLLGKYIISRMDYKKFEPLRE